MRELKKLGIDVHFEEERISTLSATGELMISLLAARAQEEARSASENQRWRIKKSFEKGIPVAGNCLGYRLVDGQFLVEEEEEQTVLRIFSMYLSGMGCPAIAKTLRKEGVKNRFGNTNPISVLKILELVADPAVLHRTDDETQRRQCHRFGKVELNPMSRSVGTDVPARIFRRVDGAE